MTRPALRLSFVAAAAILAAPADSFAQGGRSTGGGFGGSTGSSAFGGSSFGSSSGTGSSAFGSSSFGSSGFGSSGFGQSSFGQSGFGQSAFGSQGTSAFGSATGQAGNQAFIGRTGADIGATFGNANNQASQNQQRQQRAGGNRSGSDSSSSAATEVRVAITASPELQRFVATNRPAPAAMMNNVSRLLGRKGISGVSVSAEAGVATLEGTVASAADKLLAEKLAAIEPGVRRVDNRLVVQTDVEEILPSPR